MTEQHAEVLDLVRQLREELAWAMRIGYVDADDAAESNEIERTADVSPRTTETLASIRADLGDCTRCKLSCAGRTQIVFGVGSEHAEIMFVGEGPGYHEDQKGEPFVGDAGQLLTKIIEAMGYTRSEVYIANVVKCRPPNNRDPEPDEVAACEPFLKRQIAAIHPRVIVTLGRHAAQCLLRVTTPISRLRGNWGTYEGISLMPTYHPAYLLRNPAEKRAVWEDMKAVLAHLGRTPPQKGATA